MLQYVIGNQQVERTICKRKCGYILLPYCRIDMPVKPGCRSAVTTVPFFQVIIYVRLWERWSIFFLWSYECIKACDHQPFPGRGEAIRAKDMFTITRHNLVFFERSFIFGRGQVRYKTAVSGTTDITGISAPAKGLYILRYERRRRHLTMDLYRDCSG